MDDDPPPPMCRVGVTSPTVPTDDAGAGEDASATPPLPTPIDDDDEVVPGEMADD